jgi:hypothetical protein
MTAFSRIVMSGSLQIFGKVAVGSRGKARGTRLLRAALEEKKGEASALSPRPRFDPLSLPNHVYESLNSEAQRRAADLEADGILRYRHYWPQLVQMAGKIDTASRGDPIDDNRVRTILSLYEPDPRPNH